jgi:hypothetical protein
MPGFVLAAGCWYRGGTPVDQVGRRPRRLSVLFALNFFHDLEERVRFNGEPERNRGKPDPSGSDAALSPGCGFKFARSRARVKWRGIPTASTDVEPAPSVGLLVHCASVEGESYAIIRTSDLLSAGQFLFLNAANLFIENRCPARPRIRNGLIWGGREIFPCSASA